jgi:hypothetical protein
MFGNLADAQKKEDEEEKEITQKPTNHVPDRRIHLFTR